MKTKRFFSHTVGLSSLAVLLAASPSFAGSVTGKVKIDGTAPADKEIKMDADPKCAAEHKTPAMNDNFTVNADGTIQNVFVYVKAGLPAGKTYPTPTTPVQFDQKGCQYHPKVIGVMVNQPFEIVNSDPTLHNIHALPKASKEFNLGMPTQGMKVTKTFTAPENPGTGGMVKIKCDVHPWMFAYVGVMDNPYFSATGDKGTYEIKDLPDGKYTLEAWHNKYGTATAEVEVKGGNATADFTLKPPAAGAGQ
ncbi:MAG: carboxypeptidase regulatory-like domain-containing protein [Acidobacteriota bacterium]